MSGISIAFVSLKGGVGKTTVAANVAAALAVQQPQQKVLLMDTDTTGSLTSVFLAGEKPPANINEALVSGVAQTVPLRPNLNLLASDPQGVKIPFRAAVENLLDNLRKEWDWIVIDTAGGQEDVFARVLLATDYAVPVVDITPMGLAAHYRTFASLREAKKLRRSPLKIPGIIFSMVTKGASDRAFYQDLSKYPLLPFIPFSQTLRSQLGFSDALPVEQGYHYRAVENLREIARALVRFSEGLPLPYERYRQELSAFLSE